MLNCHPSQAWELMKQGESLNAIARRFEDPPAALDRAIWHWRAVHTNHNRKKGAA